jgi:HK97 family phage major capsid protein
MRGIHRRECTMTATAEIPNSLMEDLTEGAPGAFAALLRMTDVAPLKARIPLRSIFPGAQQRDLLANGTGANGGYLVSSKLMPPVDQPRQRNPVFELGGQMIFGCVGQPIFPIVNTVATAEWLTAEGLSITEHAPVFGQAAASPHHAGAFQPYSRQLTLQAPAAGSVVRDQLSRAVEDLLGAAAISGTGASGQPAGLISVSGVGSVSGTSLDHADLLSMRQKCIAGGAREAALGWVGSSATQELLGARERSTGGGRFLWDDDGILGKPAHATALCAAGTLAVGEWSQMVACIWGDSLQIEINPFHSFQAGKASARILLECDLVFLMPAAFAVSTSIT